MPLRSGKRELEATTILILGLGNPILGDDGVGIQVVRMLKEKVPSRKDLEFKELSVGGLRLVEEMLGYEKVFLIDSIEAPASEIGTIREFSVEDFNETQQTSAPHVTNFGTAFEFYKRLEPGEIPQSLRIFTVGINSNLGFSDRLSPSVQTGASQLVDFVAAELNQT